MLDVVGGRWRIDINLFLQQVLSLPPARMRRATSRLPPRSVLLLRFRCPQDTRFSAAASVGASASQRCPQDTRFSAAASVGASASLQVSTGHPHPRQRVARAARTCDRRQRTNRITRTRCITSDINIRSLTSAARNSVLFEYFGLTNKPF